MKIVLTIGGSDPTGGAGIQADLKTFKSFGVYGLSAPVSLTAQNTEGVAETFNPPTGFFAKQLDILLRDIRPDALKTGMLGSGDSIKVIGEMISLYGLKNLVVDPVTASSTGFPLSENRALELMREILFPRARVVTPNIYEASLFTGVQIQDEGDMKRAAAKFKGLGPESVIITGGHLEGKAVDLLLYEGEFLSLQREKIEGQYHGTGCTYSAAITACLALGYDVKEAAVKANEYVWEAIKSALTPGKGMKVLNM